ncbi:MAG: DNA replication and repair protein RecF [Ruminiclostridium sp.]|nr:DNA replication and repair protein RecF [Ruminiclostridium sp.]
MIIKALSVKNFRNIQNADFLFSPKTNIISGNNAQGKTNLMECLAVAVEKSFRTNKAADMLPSGDNTNNEKPGGEKLKCEINADFIVDRYSDKINTLNCSVTGKGIYRKINGVSYKDALQLYPQLKIIVFIPEDLYLIKGNPEGRRELMDDTADMMNKIHRNITGNYSRALKQKNTFLSSCEGQNSLSSSQKIQIAVWNEELAKAGVNVLCGRLKYFDTLSKYTCEYYSELNNKGEVLTMSYNHTVYDESNLDLTDTDRLLRLYLEKSEQYLQKEIIVGHTLIGVHRDDVSFFINGRNVRDFGSQGQIRSIAVALRLAQAKMFSGKWQEQPVVILDDVLSELDEYRRSFILQHIVNSQVFITGCNNNDFAELGNSRLWVARDGSFSEVS